VKSYWKDHYDFISRQFEGSPLQQVGKTVDGREISEPQVNLIVENIANILRLSAKDDLIDLCCGNGLITRQLAPIVDGVVGVDFTPGLINAAKRYNSVPNIEYINSDVLRLAPKYLSGLKKVVMYEALQHFSVEQSAQLLDGLGGLESGSLVLLGSIPNKEKLNAYYDTDEKYAYYVERESEGKPHIGRWWLTEEIGRLVSTRGFKATYLSQEPRLYTAYYRFDVLLEKCQ
jgi:SAM-dependent methyltransferase